jgi:hypothetical protein
LYNTNQIITKVNRSIESGITDPTGEKQRKIDEITQERDKKVRARLKQKLTGVGDKAQEIASSIGTTLEPYT